MSRTTVEGQLFEVEQTGVSAAMPQPPVAEQQTFRPYDPDQVLLMAPVLSEWVPEGDLVHFVSDLVERTLDLSGSMPPMRMSAAIRPMTRA